MPEYVNCERCGKLMTKGHLNRHIGNKTCLELTERKKRNEDEGVVDTATIIEIQNIVSKTTPEHLAFLLQHGIDITKLRTYSHGVKKTFCTQWKQSRSCLRCYQRCFASYEKCIYLRSSDNQKLTEISLSSHIEGIFDCPCGHTFMADIYNLTRGAEGTWCPYCCRPQQKLCENQNCQSCFNASFASHERVRYFSPLNKESPRSLFKSSIAECLFNCLCGHTFPATLAEISGGSWCPYCCVPPKKLCENSSCESCFNKSFASHPKAHCFLPENKEDPRQVFLGCSKKKYWFRCDTCCHKFDALPSNISGRRWCPYCAVPCKKLCDDAACKHCFNNSFASHSRARNIVANEKDPRTIFKGSSSKLIFACDTCKLNFSSSPSRIRRGSWCPYCLKKTEGKFKKWLQEELELKVNTQYTINGCFTPKGRPFKFDFYLPDYNVIIEIDGPQHFIQVQNWLDPSIARNRDVFKMAWANFTNHKLVRIRQEDVLRDSPKLDWRALVVQKLGEWKSDKNPRLHYISSTDCYAEYSFFYPLTDLIRNLQLT